LRLHPGQHLGVAFAALHGGQQRLGRDAGKREEALIERAGENVFAQAVGGGGAGFVEQGANPGSGFRF